MQLASCSFLEKPITSSIKVARNFARLNGRTDGLTEECVNIDNYYWNGDAGGGSPFGVNVSVVLVHFVVV